MKPARATLHLAKPEDAPAVAAPLEIQPYKGEPAKHFEARCAIIAALGVNWLRHPAYTFNPLHSCNPEVWRPAHALFWERVHARAAMDRAANPAFLRADAMRKAVGGE